MPSAERVRRAAVMTHGKPQTIGPALERLERVARANDVELLFSEDEAEKHGVEVTNALDDVDLAVVLGGDGTMLRALRRFLHTPVPVLGVNFGRVGFLASIQSDELETGLERAFAGDYRVLEVPALEAMVGNERRVAVNDVVVHSSKLGRMVELAWAVGGEDLGSLACDGIVSCAPSGSTAYNLSNGGPVLVWGIDAMAVTFVAPHSLHARPLVVPRSVGLTVRNLTPDVPAAVLVDGHEFVELQHDGEVEVRLADERSLLATLPEMTFFRRYRESFV
jgi:NAD+ kinase